MWKICAAFQLAVVLRIIRPLSAISILVVLAKTGLYCLSKLHKRFFDLWLVPR